MRVFCELFGEVPVRLRSERGREKQSVRLGESKVDRKGSARLHLCPCRSYVGRDQDTLAPPRLR